MPDAPVPATSWFFGHGSRSPSLLFILACTDSDAIAHPFESEEGQLLEKMIQALGLNTSDVHVLAICPGKEASAAELAREIQSIGPRVLVTLGELASRMAMAPPETRSVNTHDPAALLRKPELKKETWNQLLQIAEYLGLTIPNKASPTRKG